MFRAVPMWALLLLGLAGAIGLVAFGAILLKPPGKGGVLHRAAIDIAEIPHTLHQLRKSWKPVRPYYGGDYARQANGLRINRAQPFVDPGYMLLTVFDEARERPVVRMLRLSDGKTMRDYVPDIDGINAHSTFQSDLIDLRRDRDARRNLMMHPMLMPDGGLLIHDTSPLSRIDACGRTLWTVDGIFHHSVERDADGNYLAAYRFPQPREPHVPATFNDEAIATVSPAGKLLHMDRIADILDRNGLGYRWRGRPYDDDPFHLNDIQPVLTSGRYWQRGDLFISLRNLSMVMLYRPSTGKIIWRRSRPWTFQHDISIIDDHRISVFDNHWRLDGSVNGRNRIPVYNFATDKVTFPYDAGMARFAVRTSAQGRETPMPNGDIVVEETERGRLLRLAPDGTLRWIYVAAAPDRRRLQLRWSRYLDPVSDGAAIHHALETPCS